MWLHATRILIVGWEKNFSDFNANANKPLFAKNGVELFRF